MFVMPDKNLEITIAILYITASLLIIYKHLK